MECYHERAFYYWRHGYYGHVQLISSFALEKTKNDIFLRIWKSLSMGMLGKTEDAIELISRVNYREDLKLLFTVSQLCIYNISSSQNLQEIKELKKEMEKLIKKSNQFCISQSAQVAWMFNDIELSQYILSYSKEPIAISGWVKITVGEYSSAEEIFNSILQKKESDLLCLYGKYIISLVTSKTQESSDIYEKIKNQYNFPEINAEKARSLVRYGKYDQAVALLNEHEKSLPSTIEVDILSVLSSIIKLADISAASKYLERVCQICEKCENINWKLTSKLALAFSTLSCQDLAIINQTIRLSKLAFLSNPNSQFVLQVNAYHHIITRNYGVAQSILKSIDSSDKAFYSSKFSNQLILMKIFHQDQELEDSLDLYEKTENTFCISTYRSYLERRKNQDPSQYIPLIVDDLKTIINSINDENIFFSPLEIQYERYLELFISLRLETIFDSFDEIVVLNNSIRMPLTGKLGDEIEALLLDLSVPLHGYLPLLFVQAVLLFKRERYFESEFLFQSILFSKWKYRISECLAYLAQIDYFNKKTEQAVMKIDEALSLNEMLRDDYNFHLIRTEIFRDQEHLYALIPFFQQSNHSFASILKFLDLAISLNSFDAATQIYGLAKSKVSCSIEKGALILRKAKIQAGSKMFKEAFELLTKLKTHAHYLELATITESEIRYKFKVGSFIECLEDLNKKDPTSKHSEIIGDAYVKIIDFINAAKWYKKSIDLSAPSPDIFQKYISALVSSHQFGEAVLRFTEYFSSIKQNNFTLIFLLRKLIKIERFNEAKKCIDYGIHFINKTNRIVEADFFGQCGFVSWKLDDIKMARKYFKKAATIYDNIFINATFFHNAYVEELREQASLFFISYARFSNSQQKTEKAKDLYARACELDESNAEPVLELVKYYKKRYEYHKCVRLCTEFLRRYPNSERVALELTTCETSNYSISIRCLTNVLKAHPHYYRILIRLIEICARAGKLPIVESMITKEGAPGMILARGLYKMYNGMHMKAIKILSKIQDHPVWGLPAQYAILQILVNPERKYCWCTDKPLSTEEDLNRACELIDKMAKPQIIKKKVGDNDELTYKIDPIDKVILQAEVEISRNTLISISNASSLYANIIQLQDETEEEEVSISSISQNDKDKSSSSANDNSSNISNYSFNSINAVSNSSKNSSNQNIFLNNTNKNENSQNIFLNNTNKNENSQNIFLNNANKNENNQNIFLNNTSKNENNKNIFLNNANKNENNKNSISNNANKNENNQNIFSNNSHNKNIVLNSKNSSNNIIYNSNSKFVLNQDQFIAALVGLARCEFRLDHPSKAANLITQVLKKKPYHETFSYFEEAYLMRAQLFVNDGDTAQAQHFYLMTLQLNMSCKKAWEMSAMLYKKSKKYAEAADAFLHCWELSGNNDFEAGYQYALCSMKANNSEDALEMCRMINEMNPLFKDLREKVLIPSFQKLKH